MSLLKRLYVTYTKKNTESGEVYSGIASGLEDTQNSDDDSFKKILRKRDTSHHKNKDGFSEAQVDQFSEDSNAMRGREQLLIEHFGGAKSEGGSSGNEINSISKRNKKRNIYLEAAIKLFGGLSILFLLLLFLKAI